MVRLTDLRFSTQSFAISRMTPVWIFPAYPLLLIGPFAGNLSKPGRGVSNEDAVAIIVGGVIFQGMGFLLALTMHATYVYRLMTQKLPEESARPAMFISVGPSAFTVSGLVTMGSNIRSVIPSDFMGDGQLTGEIAQILAYWASIWLFGYVLSSSGDMKSAEKAMSFANTSFQYCPILLFPRSRCSLVLRKAAHDANFRNLECFHFP